MGLLKDFYTWELAGKLKRRWFKEIINPFNWQRNIKYRHQRLERGWSDRDTWDGGSYILSVTSGVLKKLGDDKSHIDWREYFKHNYPKNCGYKNLNQVAKDIDRYLEFDEYAWGDSLGFDIKHGSKELPNGNLEMISLNTPKEEIAIRKAIDKSHKEWERRYKKAQKAMKFVTQNFPSLWD